MKKRIWKKAATFVAVMSMLATMVNPAMAHGGHEGDSHPVDLGDAPLNNDQAGGEGADYDVPATQEDVPGASEQTAATTTQGGPVILMGIDAEDGGPNAHGPITVYQTIIRNILAQVKNGRSGILVLGGGKSTTDQVTKFWNEIGKGTNQQITYLNGATNLANQPFIGYAMIGVVSDVNNTPNGGLTQAENNALAMRQPNIAQFVNDGGALLGFSSRFSNPYAYMSGLGSFRVRVGMDYSNIDPTADGSAIGVTNTLDVSAWHDVYLNYPSFLKVLARDHSTKYAAAIGGADVKVIAVDEPPVVTATPDRAPNSNGWYNADVTVTFTATDEDETPVRHVDAPRVVSNEGKDMEIIGMAQDTAGYKGWGSVKLSIDKTAPTVKADLLPSVPDGENGNYKSDVNVTFVGSDNLSGIDAIEYSVNGGAWTRATGALTFTEQGDYRIETRAVDKAGNIRETASSSSFKIFKESFEVTPTFDQAPNGNGWYNSPVTVTLNPGTAGSRIEYQIDNGDWVPYTGPFVVDASCNIKFRVIGRDGTVGPIQECNLQIDRTAPGATPVLNPASPDGSNGWYTSSPSIELIGTDDLSGIDKVEYRIDKGPWIEYTGGFNLPHDCTCKIEYRSTDKAGNGGSGQFDINLDTTAPTTSATITPPDGEDGWYVTAPTLVLTGQDGGSGVGTIEYRIGSGEWIVYTGPTTLPRKCTCKITYRTTDQAGNISPEQSIDVKIDTEAPTTSATVNPSAPNGQNGWYTSEVTITLEANDDTSGCSKTQCRIVPKDGSPGEWFDYTGPIVVRDGGEFTIEYRTVDNAGNVEDTQSLPIQLDNTAPNTECILPPVAPGGWYNSPVTVTLPATDSGSGVDKTEYRVIDGDQVGEWTEYTEPFELPKNCSCRIEYRSDDRAGNTEPTQTVPVQVDTTAPTLTISLENKILWPPNHKYVPIQLKVEATDNLSGIEKIELVSIKSNESDEWLGDGHHTDDIIEAEVGTFDTEFQVRSERSGLLSGRTYTATYKATDKAGNVTLASYTITVPHDMRDKKK